ncbi:A-kinase-interacting protein 1 isoform X1 [Festucalex cinctus]
MATLSGLQYSLQKSARLGREVLERASRRKVDWGEQQQQRRQQQHTYTPVTDEESAATDDKKPTVTLQEAFSTIIAFMAETHIQCKRFYDSVGCAHGSDIERKHPPRYHRRLRATLIKSSSHLRRHHSTSPWTDCHISNVPDCTAGRLRHGSRSRIGHHQHQSDRLTATNQDGHP